MNKLTLRDYITIAGFLITIATGVYKYGQLNSKVEEHDIQLKKVSIEVLKAQIEFNQTTLGKIEEKVNKMYDKIMSLSND